MEKELKKLLAGRTPGLMDAVARYGILVLLVRQKEGYSFLYEVRAAGLHRQPGEVCFPGGKLEEGEDPVSGALRETWEELGIPKESITVLGSLDFIAHRGNAMMYPVLGVVDECVLEQLHLNPDEGEETFLVLVQKLLEMTPGSYRYRLVPTFEADLPYAMLGIRPDYHWRAGREQGPAYPWKDKVIWGLTGKMTRHVLALMKDI